jgi:hypothetical protein
MNVRHGETADYILSFGAMGIQRDWKHSSWKGSQNMAFSFSDWSPINSRQMNVFVTNLFDDNLWELHVGAFLQTYEKFMWQKVNFQIKPSV